MHPAYLQHIRLHVCLGMGGISSTGSRRCSTSLCGRLTKGSVDLLQVRQAAADAALAYGSGPRSSALVGGYTQQHAELEAALAALKGDVTNTSCILPLLVAGSTALLSTDRHA